MLGLVSANGREIGFQSFHRRNLRREDPVPAKFVGRYGEFGLRPEEMVKASLFDARLLTDLVDPDRPIALPPDKFVRSLQKALFGITKPHSQRKDTAPIGQPQQSFLRAW